MINKSCAAGWREVAAVMRSTNRAGQGGSGMWGDYDSKQVSMCCIEKVMFEHRLEGRREWPSAGRVFQAEGTARKELGWECAWHVPILILTGVSAYL